MVVSQESQTMTIKEAAKKLGTTEQFLRKSLIQERMPVTLFGWATKMEKNWEYFINRNLFNMWTEGFHFQRYMSEITDNKEGGIKSA